MNDDERSAWRAAIDAGTCPLCGTGPFRVVAGHVAQRHGIDCRSLRELIGLPRYRSSICDPAVSAACRERVEAGVVVELSDAARLAGAVASGAANRQRTAKRAAAEREAIVAAGGPVAYVRSRGGRVSNVAQRLRRRGIDVPNMRLERVARACGECGATFTPGKPAQRFCSRSCGATARWKAVRDA